MVAGQTLTVLQYNTVLKSNLCTFVRRCSCISYFCIPSSQWQRWQGRSCNFSDLANAGEKNTEHRASSEGREVNLSCTDGFSCWAQDVQGYNYSLSKTKAVCLDVRNRVGAAFSWFSMLYLIHKCVTEAGRHVETVPAPLHSNSLLWVLKGSRISGWSIKDKCLYYCFMSSVFKDRLLGSKFTKKALRSKLFGT